MQKEIRRDKIIGSRRFSNYFWASLLFIGGLMLFLIAIPVEGINWGPFPPVYYFTLLC